MAEKQDLHEMLRFDPGWVFDPVPPWVFEVLDKGVLRELAVVSIDLRQKVLHSELEALDKARDLIQKSR